MATKEREYTKPLAARMEAAYRGAGTKPENEAARLKVVNDFDKETGYGVHSIRGYMSRQGYYIAKVKRGKDGETPAVRKEVLVSQLVELTGINSVTLETVENANKIAILALVDFVTSQAAEIESLNVELYGEPDADGENGESAPE